MSRQEVDGVVDHLRLERVAAEVARNQARQDAGGGATLTLAAATPFRSSRRWLSAIHVLILHPLTSLQGYSKESTEHFIIPRRLGDILLRATRRRLSNLVDLPQFVPCHLRISGSPLIKHVRTQGFHISRNLGDVLLAAG